MDTLLTAAQWSTAYINDLPDSAFAIVEPGERDSTGRTTPRSKRHLPYKDASGKVDLPHLRNALARLPQTSLSSDLKNKARVKLEKAAKDAGIGDAAASLVAAFCDEYSSELLQKVTDLQAVGRMISQKNLKTLCDAHQILGDLIQAAQSMESARVVFDGEFFHFIEH